MPCISTSEKSIDVIKACFVPMRRREAKLVEADDRERHRQCDRHDADRHRPLQVPMVEVRECGRQREQNGDDVEHGVCFRSRRAQSYLTMPAPRKSRQVRPSASVFTPIGTGALADASTAYSCPSRLDGGSALVSGHLVESLRCPRPAMSGRSRRAPASSKCVSHIASGVQYHCPQAGSRHVRLDHCSICCGGTHRAWSRQCSEHRRYWIVAIAEPYRVGRRDRQGRREAAQRDHCARYDWKWCRSSCIDRPIYGPDGREASGLATWQAGGGVLFTSPDCTTGAHVYSSSRAGVRATTQVQTRAGISLYVGAVGQATTVSVQSILYDTGCAPVVVQQNGLHPVEATVNLEVAYPPPLSFQ